MMNKKQEQQKRTGQGVGVPAMETNEAQFRSSAFFHGVREVTQSQVVKDSNSESALKEKQSEESVDVQAPKVTEEILYDHFLADEEQHGKAVDDNTSLSGVATIQADCVPISATTPEISLEKADIIQARSAGKRPDTMISTETTFNNSEVHSSEGDNSILELEESSVSVYKQFKQLITSMPEKNNDLVNESFDIPCLPHDQESFQPYYLPYKQLTELREYGLENRQRLKWEQGMLLVTDQVHLVNEHGQLIGNYKKRKDYMISPGVYILDRVRALRLGSVNNNAVFREAKLYINCDRYPEQADKDDIVFYLQHTFMLPQAIVDEYLRAPLLLLVAGDLNEQEDSSDRILKNSERDETRKAVSTPIEPFNNSFKASILGSKYHLVGNKSRFAVAIDLDKDKGKGNSDDEVIHWEVWDISDVELLDESQCHSNNGEYEPNSDFINESGVATGMCIPADHSARKQYFHWREAAALEQLNQELQAMESIWKHGAILCDTGLEVADRPNERDIVFSQAGRYIIRCIVSLKSINNLGLLSQEQYVATHHVRVRDLKKIADEELDRPAVDVVELKLRIKNIQGMADSSPAKAMLKELEQELIQRRLIARGTTLALLERRLQNTQQDLAKRCNDPSAFDIEQIRDSKIYALEKQVDELQAQLHLARDRLQNIFQQSGKKVHRLKAVLVSEVTGESYPLIVQISEPYWEAGQCCCLLSDVTDRSGKLFKGCIASFNDKTDDIAMTAIENALQQFAQNSGYGSGIIKVRLPNTGWYQQLSRRQREYYFKIQSTDWQGARARLSELGTAIALLGLVVSTPALSFTGSAIGAGVSGIRIIERVSTGEFQWDSQAIGDLITVLGFAAGML